VNGNAPLREFVGHHVGSADFFKAQLGVRMQVAANGGHAGGVGYKGV
jgi:hypothetical protein